MLSFMFLFTAYSANIVALLQSVTNDINSIEALLKSPLRVGAEDFAYSRQFFSFNEKRPIHRQLWLKKGAPLGEKFFIPTAEGIRRVREGMFAFHVEPTAGFDLIQATFFEHEKCSFGVLKYIMMPNPIVATARDTHIRDVLRIGVLRILEGGVQSRSNRRLLPKLPRCPDGMALFTEVSLTDVAPGFVCLLALYGVAVAVLVLEVAVHWRESHKKNFEEQFEDFEDNGVYEFNE
ncbi:hypothetical protein JYU34_012122 [Plutella xylostella]|uniref:Ionotropic receptor n=1 Tax=Plutella xylostella TaxID=51655 RepID=A0ABQ7QI27_PLUXY|nr:hypothetical protein JYU34_012122 [Plutella xylostella]